MTEEHTVCLQIIMNIICTKSENIKRHKKEALLKRRAENDMKHLLNEIIRLYIFSRFSKIILLRNNYLYIKQCALIRRIKNPNSALSFAIAYIILGTSKRRNILVTEVVS